VWKIFGTSDWQFSICQKLKRIFVIIYFTKSVLQKTLFLIEDSNVFSGPSKNCLWIFEKCFSTSAVFMKFVNSWFIWAGLQIPRNIRHWDARAFVARQTVFSENLGIKLAKKSIFWRSWCAWFESLRSKFFKNKNPLAGDLESRSNSSSIQKCLI